MTYAKYSKQLSDYTKAISLRRSLQMTIHMNTAWLTNKNSKRGQKRLAVIEQAKKELNALIIPPKPKQPIGYQVLVDGVFEGFINTDNVEVAKDQAIEYLGHTNFTLKSAPRFRD